MKKEPQDLSNQSRSAVDAVRRGVVPGCPFAARYTAVSLVVMKAGYAF